MSFFTNAAYSQFHQAPQPTPVQSAVITGIATPTSTSSASKLSSLQQFASRDEVLSSCSTVLTNTMSPPQTPMFTAPPKPASLTLNGLQQSQLKTKPKSDSIDSTTSTASLGENWSQFDPLSPQNRDPFAGNDLTSNKPGPPPSLKVYAIETTEEWGEFLEFKSDKQRSASDKRVQTRTVTKRRERAHDLLDNSSSPTGIRKEGEDEQEEEEEDTFAYMAIPFSCETEDEKQGPLGSSRSFSIDKEPLVPDRIRGISAPVPPTPFTSPTNASATNAVSPPSLSSFFSRWSFNNSNPPALKTAASAPSFSTLAMEQPRSANRDSYDVFFDQGPIGLELETDYYGRHAVVKGFKRLGANKNEMGPAERCKLIHVGDVLTAINGESILELSFPETLAKLRQVGATRHVLHFKSLEAAGDLSAYTMDSDICQAKKFIHEYKERFYKPLPQPENANGLINCSVERLRGNTVTSFNLHREDTGEFLMACSCVNECTGVFVFHTLQDAHLREFKDIAQSEDNSVYLGKMVGNFLGKEFTLYDHKARFKPNMTQAEACSSMGANELAFLVFNQNVLGRIPNFLKVVFPRDITLETRQRRAATEPTYSLHYESHNTTKVAERYKLQHQVRQVGVLERIRSFSLEELGINMEGNFWSDADDLAGAAREMRIRAARQRSMNNISQLRLAYGALEQDDNADLLVFETKQPSWNDELNAWTLNFHGRVKLPSKKNFLLVPELGNDGMESEFGVQEVNESDDEDEVHEVKEEKTDQKDDCETKARDVKNKDKSGKKKHRDHDDEHHECQRDDNDQGPDQDENENEDHDESEATKHSKKSTKAKKAKDKEYLRFGKVTKTRFALDFQAPFSPMLALAIACSSFAHKIAVT